MRHLVLLMALLLPGVAVNAAEHVDRILIQGNDAGQQTVTTNGDGRVRAEYSYNNRGRGDHIVATWKPDAQGIPVDYSGNGNSYRKANLRWRCCEDVKWLDATN